MIDLSQKCRSCLEEGGEMKRLFLEENNQLMSLDFSECSLDKMLMGITQLRIEQNEKLPKQICLNCVDKLKNSFFFIKMCHESETALKKYLQNSTDCDDVKRETPVNNERIISIDDIFHLDTVPPTVKLELNDHNRNESHDNIFSCSFPRRDHKVEKYTQTLLGEVLQLHNCPQCKKKFHSDDGLRNHLKRHLKITLACSHCDSVFTKNEDLKRHTENDHKINMDVEKYEIPEEDLVCSVCHKKFHNKRLFEKHKKSHNSKKRINTKNQNGDSMSVSNVEKYNSKGRTIKTCTSSNENISEAFSPQQLSISYSDDKENDTLTNKDSESVANGHKIDIGFIKFDEDVKIKVEPLDDILEKADRESQLSVDDADFHLDMNDIDLEEYSRDPEFIPARNLKRIGRKKTIKKKPKIRPIIKTRHNNYCSICKIEFISKHEMLSHHRNFHEGELLGKTSLDDVLNSVFKCGTCDREFNRKDYLERHVWQHMEHKPFQCDICPKAFLKHAHLKRHQTALHSGKEKKRKTVFCEICSSGFTTEKYLNTHMRMHTGDKTFTCDVCNKSFNSKSHLKEHKKWHSSEKPFLCSECGRRFIRNDYLIIHMRRHKGEKPFKCKFCNKGFPRSTDLFVHERYHTNEKTHLCTVCGKGFQRRYNLTVHLRVHTGEKPYVCTYCGKKFAQGNDLKSHVRRHTGERFTCEICAEGFIQGYHLTQHKRSVHGIENPSHIKRLAKHPFSQPGKANVRMSNDDKNLELEVSRESDLLSSGA